MKTAAVARTRVISCMMEAWIRKKTIGESTDMNKRAAESFTRKDPKNDSIHNFSISALTTGTCHPYTNPISSYPPDFLGHDLQS